ncbi:MAG: hypothetical protein ACLUNV_08980 [Sutterella wadsworthensis]
MHFTEGFDLGVGLDAPEFDVVDAGERGLDLVVDAVALHGAAAEGDEDAHALGDVAGEEAISPRPKMSRVGL